MTLYLAYGNLVVCEDHKNLVDLVQRDAKPENELEAHGLPVVCMICETPPEAGRACEYEACKQPLHERWPGLYCSVNCAWRDSL